MTTLPKLLDSSKRPLRVLHVLGSMNKGGVETWLMNIIRTVSRADLAFDFLVQDEKPAAYDKELLELGANRYVCVWPQNPIQYALNIFKILRKNGPYDVVHSHVHYFSGFIMLISKVAGVPVRISHSHTDSTVADGEISLARKAYLKITGLLIKYFSTSGLAASEKAALSLFGEKWKEDKRWKIAYCGIDLQPFAKNVDRVDIRRNLGIATQAFVIGHVGRFDAPKNQNFLIEIFYEIKSDIDNAILLLIGDGELKEGLEARVKASDFKKDIIFTGVRDDIPQLMMGAMDIFVFPSRLEGLGLVCIEAQAANLPCFVSDVVPHEVKVTDDLIFLSLDDGPKKWAEEIKRNLSKQRLEKDDRILEFDIKRSIKSLKVAYGRK